MIEDMIKLSIWSTILVLSLMRAVSPAPVQVYPVTVIVVGDEDEPIKARMMVENDKFKGDGVTDRYGRVVINLPRGEYLATIIPEEPYRLVKWVVRSPQDAPRVFKVRREGQ